MMYDSIVARSFSRHEQKRLGYGAIVCCFLVILFFCTFFKPYLAPIPTLNLQVSIGTVGLQMLAAKAANSSQQTIKSVPESNWLELISIHGPKNLSDHLQHGNSNPTSQHDHYSLEISKNNRTRNVGNDVQKKNNSTHYTSPHHEWGVSTNESNIVTALQVDNSTSQQYNAKTGHQNSETLIIEEVVTEKIRTPLCNKEKPRTEFCEIKTDIKIDTKSSSVFVISSSQTNDGYISAEGNNSLSTIRPYARKEDAAAMSQVRKWSVLLKPAKGDLEFPRCTQNHSVPAILFSLGGYVGNNFHEFTDVVIPLYITSRQYNGEVQFLVTDNRPYFLVKFRKLLKRLSKYEIIDIDKEEQIYCFPSATIGLKRHPKEMSIDPIKHSYSMRDFKEFLRDSYSLNRSNAIHIRENGHQKKPRLLILSRRRTRAFTNIGEIKRMATSLGYNVLVAEADANVARFSELVNSCDVLMGVHGAGLTNIVFLPENAVFIQVVPIGGFEWLANNDFGEPSKDMNLNYLEYTISKEESTLINQYPLDHAVFTDPYSIGKDWNVFQSIFLEKQNVTLDVNRFKPTLVKALQLLHQK